MAATTKVTVTLQDKQPEEIQKLVVAGGTASVSAFVQHAVRIALHDAAGWQELLRSALEPTGGSLKENERAWAGAVLGKPVRRKAFRRGKAA